VLPGEPVRFVKNVQLVLLKFKSDIFIHYAIWASVNREAIVSTHDHKS
jgi:hypothetical protein